MAAASYTHDLTDWIADSDTTAWGELTNATSGGVPDEADTESALQGTNTVSQSTNTTGLCSMMRILGTPVTLSSGQVALVWHGHGVATALQSYASGGFRVAFAGGTLADWKSYYVGGNDVPPMPYGKWVNNAVDPTVTADASNGTPPTNGTNIYGIGSMCQLSAVVAKGQPHVCDIIRYGRAEARINGGDVTNGYATFAGFAALNDAQTARWGLIQSTTGGYLWKGLLTLGYASAVDFRDSNVNIFIQDCRKVSSTFNKIEIRQAASRVDWTNISFINASPSTNASKGSLEVIDDCDVNIVSCTFVDMATFIFKAISTIDTSTFRRCGAVTGGGANFDRCTFDSTTGTSAVIVADLGKLDYCSFTSDGSSHAVELTTAGSYTWTGTGTGYDAGVTGSPVTPTNTGNEMIYVSASTGTVDISVATGATIPSIKSAGATVNVTAGAVTVTVTVTTEAGVAINGARVFLFAKDATGDMPYQDTVTISNSGTTATVTHTAHNMLTNDKVLIEGASLDANNGVYPITYINANSYSYTMGSAPGSSPTGTIKATWTAIYDETVTAGTLSMTRVFSIDQPVAGWARKSTSSPYYKTGSISGIIDSGTGASLTALLLSDE